MSHFQATNKPQTLNTLMVGYVALGGGQTRMDHMKTFLKSTTAIVTLIGAMSLLTGAAEARNIHTGAKLEISQNMQAKAEATDADKQAKADARAADKQAKADAKAAEKQAKADAKGDEDGDVVGSDDQDDDVASDDDQDDDPSAGDDGDQGVDNDDDEGDDVDVEDETDVEGVDD